MKSPTHEILGPLIKLGSVDRNSEMSVKLRTESQIYPQKNIFLKLFSENSCAALVFLSEAMILAVTSDLVK